MVTSRRRGCQADLSGAILRQGLTGKTTGGVEGANETHGWRDQPVQNPAEDPAPCERRHDTQIPADEPSPGDVSPGGRGGRGERPGRRRRVIPGRGRPGADRDRLNADSERSPLVLLPCCSRYSGSGGSVGSSSPGAGDHRRPPPGLARVQADVQRTVDAGEVRLSESSPSATRFRRAGRGRVEVITFKPLSKNPGALHHRPVRTCRVLLHDLYYMYMCGVYPIVEP